MKFSLSEAKIAKFNEETGEYKEVDMDNTLNSHYKAAEISAESDDIGGAQENTTLILQMLYGGYTGQHTGNKKFDTVFDELFEATKETNKEFQKNLYRLMILHNVDSANIKLENNMIIYTTRGKLRELIGEVDANIIEKVVKTLLQSGYTIMDDFKTEVRYSADVMITKQKFAALAIMKKYNLTDIGFKYSPEDELSTIKITQLEDELSEDSLFMDSMRSEAEIKYHIKLK